MNSFAVTLEARNPALGHFRSYHIEAGRDLFGHWQVAFTYGRIGRRGRTLRHVVDTESEARRLVRQALVRRRTAPRRIGAAYETVELYDPECWLMDAVPQ